MSAMVVGLAAIAGPAILLGLKGSSHPYYPAIINGIDHYSLLTVLFQFIGGVALGTFNPKRPWRWGFAMMAPFPVLTFVDVAHGFEQHQLWPFEMLMYVILALPCIGGALLGSYLKGKLGEGHAG